jgi:nucleotide-binding universal stress UspA family protein
VDVRVAEGLAARVLLDHAVGAELLVLGSATRCAPDGIGPVARACLRRAPCPVVVVSVEMTGIPVPA